MNGSLRSGLILALVVTALAVCLPHTPDRLAGQGQELVSNGGFEAAGLAPWYASPNLVPEQVTDPRYEGQYAAKLTVTDGRVGGLWQVASPAPGAGTYELSAWVGAGENVKAVYVVAEWYESPDATGSFIQDYRLDYGGAAGVLSGQVTVGGDARSVRVAVWLEPASGGGPATGFVDAVSLRFTAPATPGPSATPTPTATPGQSGPTPTPEPTPAHYEPGSLVFNELLYDPGISGCGTDCEWVELVNTTGRPIDLRGWTLADNARSDPLPAAVIPAGGVAVIAATAGAVPSPGDGTFVLVVMPTGRVGNGLNNDGDRLTLTAPDGTVVAALSYGDDGTYPPVLPTVKPGWSLERLPAVTGGFRASSQPSPGRLSPVCCLGWLPAVVAGKR